MTALVFASVAAAVVVVGLALALVLTVRRQAIRPAAGTWLGAAVLALTTAAVVATVFDEHVAGARQETLALLTLVLAVGGGAVVTTTAFALVDAGDRTHESDGIAEAGRVLRGGAWIGALERLAVFASLAARWPEGIAVVLAVKGLGRYPELRSRDRTASDPSPRRATSAAAERFIIGTLVSMGWAAACAYLAFGSRLGSLS